jgi:hypothetical protein
MPNPHYRSGSGSKQEGGTLRPKRTQPVAPSDRSRRHLESSETRGRAKCRDPLSFRRACSKTRSKLTSQGRDRRAGGRQTETGP